jgi:hypothetical protein
MIAAIALALPFMLGNRTPAAISASLMRLIRGAFLAHSRPGGQV